MATSSRRLDDSNQGTPRTLNAKALEIPFQLPGVEHPPLSLRITGLLSNFEVVQNGQPLARRKGNRYAALDRGGNELEFQFQLPVIIFRGKAVRLPVPYRHLVRSAIGQFIGLQALLFVFFLFLMPAAFALDWEIENVILPLDISVKARYALAIISVIVAGVWTYCLLMVVLLWTSKAQRRAAPQ